MSELTALLHKFFGKNEFRGSQREVIEALLNGSDVLAIWPTGAGKSLTYQLPALILPGLTIVVSPLIALMEDQVRQLQQRSLPAVCLNSSQSPDEQKHIIELIKEGRIKLLFASPERLLEENFLDTLRRCRISILAVDEAHCINQWGHDFRSSYLHLGELVKALRPRSILAVTATADQEAAEEIAHCLGMSSPFMSRLSLDRPNLYYKVIKIESKQRKWLALNCLRSSRGHPSVVYAARRNQTEKLAAFFRQHNLTAAPYHAGLPTATRQRILTAFLEGQLNIITATTAFGMGVDKPDIRQTIHMSPPASPENYFQESGRAGRDRQPASCLLFWDAADFNYLSHSLEDSYPQKQEISHFAKLADQGDQTIADMRSNYFRAMSYPAWEKLLRTALGENADLSAPPELLLNRTYLFDYFEVLKARARRRLQAIETYCRTHECRRQALLAGFAEIYSGPCRQCDNCRHRQRLLNMTVSRGA
ncbi:MAG: RecQ family ATP-dependent DNA helicase [Candidatus Bruticola sp.]